MSRDLKLGVDFAGVSYYDGQGFLAVVLDGFTSALQLEGARICVIEGTTTADQRRQLVCRAQDQGQLHDLCHAP